MNIRKTGCEFVDFNWNYRIKMGKMVVMKL
jgi:hypothetical protein